MNTTKESLLSAIAKACEIDIENKRKIAEFTAKLNIKSGYNKATGEVAFLYAKYNRENDVKVNN
jgi:hypothetical protein